MVIQEKVTALAASSNSCEEQVGIVVFTTVYNAQRYKQIFEKRNVCGVQVRRLDDIDVGKDDTQLDLIMRAVAKNHVFFDEFQEIDYLVDLSKFAQRLGNELGASLKYFWLAIGPLCVDDADKNKRMERFIEALERNCHFRMATFTEGLRYTNDIYQSLKKDFQTAEDRLPKVESINVQVPIPTRVHGPKNTPEHASSPENAALTLTGALQAYKEAFGDYSDSCIVIPQWMSEHVERTMQSLTLPYKVQAVDDEIDLAQPVILVAGEGTDSDLVDAQSYCSLEFRCVFVLYGKPEEGEVDKAALFGLLTRARSWLHVMVVNKPVEVE